MKPMTAAIPAPVPNQDSGQIQCVHKSPVLKTVTDVSRVRPIMPMMVLISAPRLHGIGGPQLDSEQKTVKYMCNAFVD